MCGMMPVQHDAQRSVLRASVRALKIALCHQEVTYVVIHTDNLWVEHALEKEEIHCICADHNEADWWA